MEKARQAPSARRMSLTQTAVCIAEAVGYYSVTREAVAKRAHVSRGLVNHYLGTVGEMQHRIIRVAIANNNLAVVAQAVLREHPLVHGPLLSDKMREDTAAYMVEKAKGPGQ